MRILERIYNEMYPEGRRAVLGCGAYAPDFSLRSTPEQWLSLHDFRGQPVILAFYPADWSPVCCNQLALYNQTIPELKQLGASLIGISVDGIWCHSAFSRDYKFQFPLLADSEPKGAVARRYGVFREGDGVSERALFLVNPEGVIHWSYVSPIGVNPGTTGIFAALKDLKGITAQ